jgi:phosphohistidine phosphatase SixA
MEMNRAMAIMQRPLPRTGAPTRSSLLAVLLLACQAWASVAAAEANDAWALLKKPGHIVLLRHSNAPGNVPESNDMNFKDCTIQRNLDAEGRAQAARIGDTFRKHGIRQVRLLSSQYCRAMETAKLTKLGAVKELPALNQVFLANPLAMREAGIKAREFMKSIPAKQLTVLVTHVTNIQSIAGVQLESGEMAVVHLDRSGDVVVDGRIVVP